MIFELTYGFDGMALMGQGKSHEPKPILQSSYHVFFAEPPNQAEYGMLIIEEMVLVR